MSTGSYTDPGGNHIQGVIVMGLATTAGNGAQVGDAVPIGQNGAVLAVSGGVGGGSGGSSPSAATGAASTSAVPIQDAASGKSIGLDSSLQSILTALGGSLKVFAPGGGALALDATLTSGSAKVQVGNFPTTQAVSLASLPLPAGAAQDSTLTSGNAKAQITNFPATQPISATALPLPSGAAQDTTLTNGNLKAQVTNFPANQAVSVSTLPLPAGAAQDATLTSGNAKIQVASLPALPAGTANIGNVGINNFPATQPISAASLPLPNGAATDANLASIVTALNGILRTAPPKGPVTAGAVSATSSTANTPVALFAAGSISNGWCVQNPPGSGYNITVDMGGGTFSSPVTPIVLQPGQTLAPNFNPSNVVNVWSSGASVGISSGKW